VPDLATLTAWGLPGLFIVAMLAGSVLPVPSEPLLAALVYGGTPLEKAVVVATAGNVLGALWLYLLGRWVARGGSPLGRWAVRRAERQGPRVERAKVRLRTWGAPALFLSWLPILGDALVFAAGFIEVRVVPFLLFATLGKGVRYLIVALGAALV
jgi:membrane protein YqaA with SNARE-associated domain